MHVDHILPRSKYPELELWFMNQQVLCKWCNWEKSNTDYTDYRDIEAILNKVNHETPEILKKAEAEEQA